MKWILLSIGLWARVIALISPGALRYVKHEVASDVQKFIVIALAKPGAEPNDLP